jgi:septal ring factor EnvC (AmiA/AmiB activator)
MTFVCGALLLAGAVAGVGAADEQAELRKRTQSLEHMRGRMQALDRELAESRGRHDALLQEIEQGEVKLEELRKRLAAHKALTTEKTAALRKTRAEREALEKKLSNQRALLGRQVRAAYLMGRRGTAKLVLRQDDISRMERLLTHFEYLNRARTRSIANIAEQKSAVRALEERQEQQAAELAAAQADHEKMVAALASAGMQRTDMLRKLRSRISGGESELEQLRAGERELVTLINKLKDLLAEIPAGFHTSQPLGKQKGRLPWPARGRLLANYGAPKAGGKLKWSGIWIAATEGSPVRAVANGRVAYVGRLQRFGLLAVVEHGDGYYTLYGHAAEIIKAAGDSVRAGEVLGRAGTSGGHDQSGVYFELRKGSQPVDPKDWLGR